MIRRQLWSIGRWPPLRGVNALGSILAFLGLLAVSLGLVAGLVATAVYEHRDAIDRERAPIVVLDDERETALLWQQIGSGGVADRVVEVIGIEPLHKHAPLPPGVRTWPAPGEAVVSPALRTLLLEVGAPDRYGRQVGTIGLEGLASQTELLAYIRPPFPLDPEQGAWPLAGFGVSRGGGGLPFGETLYDRSVTEFWSLSLLLVVLPGLVAVVAAARVADNETRRRHLLLERIGASRWARAVAATPHLVQPLVASLLVGVTLGLASATVDIAIPFKGNVIDARIVRGILPTLLIVIVVVNLMGVVWLAFLAAGRSSRENSATRLTAPKDPTAWGRTILLLIVLAAQPWVVALVDSRTTVMLATLVAAGMAVVCLPAAVATLLHVASVRRSRTCLNRRRVGGFLAWRITEHRSKALARLAGSLCALVVVVGHAAAVLAMFTGPALDARLIERRIGHSLLIAEQDISQIEGVLRLARDRGMGAVIQSNPLIGASTDGTTEMLLIGPCEDLSMLGVSCAEGPLVREGSSPRLDAILDWYSNPTTLIAVGSSHRLLDDPTEQHFDVLLLSPDGQDLDVERLAADAYEAGLRTRIGPLGTGARLGAADLLHKSYWIFVFGVPGVLTLLIVGAVTWAAVVIEESHGLARSPLIADRQDVFTAVAWVRVGLPILVAGVAGALSTGWLLAPHSAIGALDLPTGFFLSVAIASGAVAAGGWWVAQRSMAAVSIRRWEG